MFSLPKTGRIGSENAVAKSNIGLALIAERNVPCNCWMQVEGECWKMSRVGVMQRNESSNREVVEGIAARPARRVSGQIQSFPSEGTQASEKTDPFASEGPLLGSSEWPSSAELDSAMRDSDPFELRDGSTSLTGEIAELFGEIEPRLPRDTLPSPPPSLDEPLRFELPRTGRLP